MDNLIILNAGNIKMYVVIGGAIMIAEVKESVIMERANAFKAG